MINVTKTTLASLLVAFAVFVGLAALTSAPVVLAHANLVRAEPAPNSVLDVPPTRVTIWFTEPLEPEFSRIRVLNTSGQQVDNEDTSFDPNDPTVMSVSLPELPNGTYTVAWNNVSTVDGHLVRSAFVFSVGEPIAASASADAGTEQALFQSPAEPVIRWLVLLSILTVVGGLFLELVISGPVLAKANRAANLLGEQWQRKTLALNVLAIIVFLIASITQLLIQAGAVFETSVFGAIGSPSVSILTNTTWGSLWLWRIVLLALTTATLGFVFVGFRGRRELPDNKSGLVLKSVALIFGLGVLLTISLTSHAGATPGISTAAILNDYLHLLAVGVWVGGLFHLTIGVSLIITSLPDADRRNLLAGLIPRFSVAAVLSVGVLIITGLYSAWAQVTVIPALFVPYGQSLIAKLALVAVLLLIGAGQLLWIRPRLRETRSAAAWLRRLLIAEAIIAILVILSVGFLTSLEPARQVASREGIGQKPARSFEDTSEGANIHLEIEPGQVGLNRVTVSLTNRLGNPIANASDVRVRISYLDDDLGEEFVSAAQTSNGAYEIDDALIAVAGAWQAEIAVQRPDAFDARTAFRFEASNASGAGSAAISPEPETGTLLLGIELALIGFLFLGTGIPLGGWYSRSGMSVMGPGIASVFIGAVLIINVQFGDQESDTARNPFAPNPESLAIGLEVYNDNCQTCHGTEGRGDGPAAEGLEPPPADLIVHVPLHPDRALFGFINDGIDGTAMAPLGDKLTDEEIWHAINYIRTLE